MTNKFLANIGLIGSKPGHTWESLEPTRFSIVRVPDSFTSLRVFTRDHELKVRAELAEDYETSMFPWNRHHTTRLLEVTGAEGKRLMGYIDRHWIPRDARWNPIEEYYGHSGLGYSGNSWELYYSEKPKVYVSSPDGTSEVDRHVCRLLMTIILNDDPHGISREIWQYLLQTV